MTVCSTCRTNPCREGENCLMLHRAQDYVTAETDEAAVDALFDKPDWADDANLTTIAELRLTSFDDPAVARVLAKIANKKFTTKQLPDGHTCRWCSFVLRDTTGDLRVVGFGDVATRLNTTYERNQSVELLTRSLLEDPVYLRKERMAARDCKLQVILDNHDGTSCLIPSQSDVAEVQDAAPPASSCGGSKKFNKYEALVELARLYEEKFEEPLSSVLLNVDGGIGTGDDPTAYMYFDGVWVTGKSQFSKLLCSAGSRHHETDNVELMYKPEAQKWNDHMRELKYYHQIVAKMKKSIQLSDEELAVAMQQGLLEPEAWLNKRVPPPPEWERHIPGEEDRPAQCILLIDDCLGQNALLNSTGLMRLACLNRHVAPLDEPWTSKRTGMTRSAIGLSLIYLTQTFKCQGPGPSCTLRENLTCASVWRNRQPKMLQAVTEELGSIVGQRRLAEAYNIAMQEEYGAVTCEFRPANPDNTFRLGLDRAIIIPEVAGDETKAVANTSATGIAS